MATKLMNHIAQIVVEETIEAKHIICAEVLNAALQVRDYTQSKSETQQIVRSLRIFIYTLGCFAKIIGDVSNCSIFC